MSTISKMTAISHHESWKPVFDRHLKVLESIEGSYYPNKDDIFKVFAMPVTEIRVLLLGQDPYHGANQAHGLSFSVPNRVVIPPSLKNIFKELHAEFPERKYQFASGNLEPWADREKIFLLNAALTVAPSQPGSHMERWRAFTDDVIRWVSENNPKCVFLLLGKFAQGKQAFIRDKSRIIRGVHPSPLSASKGFFNSSLFIQLETLLGGPINWQN